MKKSVTPYCCHLFVCANVRENRPDNPGCGARGGEALKAVLKHEINERGWKGRVRVSTTGCMGLCGEGPNILLHPQGIHFSGVTEHDLEELLRTVAELVE